MSRIQTVAGDELERLAQEINSFWTVPLKDRLKGDTLGIGAVKREIERLADYRYILGRYEKALRAYTAGDYLVSLSIVSGAKPVQAPVERGANHDLA